MKMKKLLFLISAALVLSAAPVSAQYIEQSDFALTTQEQEDLPIWSVLVNGKGVIDFKGQTPYNKQGYVFVPIRGVFEQMGYEVDFDAETKTAYLNSKSHSVELTLGNEYFIADGNVVYPEVPQFIMNGSFMLPIRAVAEAVDVTVGYNPETYVITLDYVDESSNVEAPWSTYYPKKDTTTEATTEETTEAEASDDVPAADISFVLDNSKYHFNGTKIPVPSRKYQSPFGFTWYVYNTTATKYSMIGVDDEKKIVAFYSQSPGFSFEGLEYGEDDPGKFTAPAGYTAKYYTKKGSGRISKNTVYALFVCQSKYMDDISYSKSTVESINDEFNYMLSAFRINEGNSRNLENSKYEVAKTHTEDLAENNGNASSSFEDKLIRNGLQYEMPEYVLFETSAPGAFYFDIINNIVNDLYAYDSLTYRGYYFIDHALSYNDISNTLYYAQNIYISKEEYDKGNFRY